MKSMESRFGRNIVFQRIRAARKKLGITQMQLAARLQVLEININQVGVCGIECNRRAVTDYEVAAFAKALRVAPGWLLEEFDAEQVRDD